MKIFNIAYLFCAGTYGDIYMFTCVQVHMFVWMSMLTCVYAYGNQRTISDRITEAPPILFVVFLGFGVFVCLFSGVSLTWNSPRKLGWLDNEPPVLTDIESSGLGLWEFITLLGFFFSPVLWHSCSNIHACKAEGLLTELFQFYYILF